MKKKWEIDRRRFLRSGMMGVGTLMGLPLLEAMIPSVRRAYGADALPKRYIALTVPNGFNMTKLLPTAAGVNYALSPTLQPLAPHKADFTLVSHLNNYQRYLNVGDYGADHVRGSGEYLTCSGIWKTLDPAQVRAGGISLDQVVSAAIKGDTRVPFLSICGDRWTADRPQIDGQYRTYSYNAQGKPITQITDPHEVWRQLFDGITPSSGQPDPGLVRARNRKLSIIDLVLEDANSLHAKLGHNDQQKMDEYLNSVREIERKLETVAPSVGPSCSPPPQPSLVTGITSDWGMPRDSTGNVVRIDVLVRLYADMLALAFQCDLTRVVTFSFAGEASQRNYGFLFGSSEPWADSNLHHSNSHHQNDPEKLRRVGEIDLFLMQQFAYFLNKLKTTSEGAGNLLQNSVLTYGSALGDGNSHDQNNVATILAGGLINQHAQGRYIERDVKLSNLWVTVLHALGINQNALGDSNGNLDSDLLAS